MCRHAWHAAPVLIWLELREGDLWRTDLTKTLEALRS